MSNISYTSSTGGYTLSQAPIGLWRYEQYSAIQGRISGRVVLLQPPQWWEVEDEADMERLTYNPAATKAEMLIHHGREIRWLRTGYRVQ